MKNIFLPVLAFVLILASCAPQPTQEPYVDIYPAECDKLNPGESIPLGLTGSSLPDSPKKVYWQSSAGEISDADTLTAFYNAPLDVDNQLEVRIIVTLDFGQSIKTESVARDCIIVPLRQSAEGDTPTPGGVEFSFTSKIIASITNLYSGPGLKYNIVVRGVHQKTQVEIIGKTASSYWLYVKINDNGTARSGWLYQNWVEITGLDLDDVPVSSNFSTIQMPTVKKDMDDINKEMAAPIIPPPHIDSQGENHPAPLGGVTLPSNVIGPALPTDVPATEPPVTEAPTEPPVTEAPTEPPVTEAPTEPPVTEAPVVP